MSTTEEQIIKNTTEELPSSQLGTEEYWNRFYCQELENFAVNKNEGEIWFGHPRMMKVVKWISRYGNQESSLLDIGCGNGVLLLQLADEGFSNLYGLDYSAPGIELARQIADENQKEINYTQADFLNLSTMVFQNDHVAKFDICHDKGTYDAISLRPFDAKLARQKYINTLKHILRNNGIFIITSCNWTLDDLKEHFCSDFHFKEHIPAPKFQFGGQSGSTVSTAVFTKQ